MTQRLTTGLACLLMVGFVATAANVAKAVNWDNGAPDDFLWSTPGNWQEDGMNGPGGTVPSNESVFFDFGPCFVTTTVPAVKDIFVANAVPPPDPDDPNAATNHTDLTIQSGGVLTMTGGQLKVGAFTGFDSPPSGVSAAVNIIGTGIVNSQYGVVTNPLYHPTYGNISSEINIGDDGVLNGGTGLFLGGGDTTINMSGNAMFVVPDGIWENGSGTYDPNNVSNPYGINAVINLSGNARFMVPNTGDFAVDETTADLYISSGLFQGDGIMHFVDGDYRVFMATTTALLGDYNGDNVIDAADYTAWRDAVTAGATSLPNDPTPGTVDETDFLYWRDHFGESLGVGSGAAAASEAVPEPSGLLLAVLAIALPATHRKSTLKRLSA